MFTAEHTEPAEIVRATASSSSPSPFPLPPSPFAVGLVYDPIYLAHDTVDHVESPSRLRHTLAELERRGLRQRLAPVPVHPVSEDVLEPVHSRRQIEAVQLAAAAGGRWLDSDTFVSPRSYTVALAAVGGAIAATDAVLSGQVASCLALLRPPGHHATPSRSMGFCLFNNAALAARHALDQGEVERILLVDYDVHHGNGTQEIFYADPRLLYVSLHQSPLYPGTGSIGETGSGAGEGMTINIPLPPGSGDAEYRRACEEILLPAAARYQPQLLLASIGFDAYWQDPLASMRLSVPGYAELASILSRLASEHSNGRLALFLEGGYHPVGLSQGVAATVAVLLGQTLDGLEGPAPSAPTPGIDPIVSAIRSVHGL
ncbi:MAG: histone deacetylase [Chloroflexi bacterium]|nr:histone deacetylase [Chloroflexota bacterium]